MENCETEAFCVCSKQHFILSHPRSSWEVDTSVFILSPQWAGKSKILWVTFAASTFYVACSLLQDAGETKINSHSPSPEGTPNLSRWRNDKHYKYYGDNKSPLDGMQRMDSWGAIGLYRRGDRTGNVYPDHWRSEVGIPGREQSLHKLLN